MAGERKKLVDGNSCATTALTNGSTKKPEKSTTNNRSQLDRASETDHPLAFDNNNLTKEVNYSSDQARTLERTKIMKPDVNHHRTHDREIQLEKILVDDHPVLEPHILFECPRDDCEYYELQHEGASDDHTAEESLTTRSRLRLQESISPSHDIEPSFDLDSRLEELREKVNLPVYYTYHHAGCGHEKKKAFRSYEEAKAFIFGKYDGTGDGSGVTRSTIRQTKSRTHGTHTQGARETNYPAVFAVINTALDPDHYQYVAADNLVPFAEDYPESEVWRSIPSVEEFFEEQLNPPNHIISSRYREKETSVPDFYDGTALEWTFDAIPHYEVVIQTPDLFLEDEEIETAMDCTDNWAPEPTSYPS